MMSRRIDRTSNVELYGGGPSRRTASATTSATAAAAATTTHQREQHDHSQNAEHYADAAPVVFLPFTGQDHAQHSDSTQAGPQIQPARWWFTSEGALNMAVGPVVLIVSVVVPLPVTVAGLKLQLDSVGRPVQDDGVKLTTPL